MIARPTIVDETLVSLGPDDLGRLTRLCLACTGFFELVEGQPAGDAAAAEILGPLPPEYAGRVKHVFAVERAGDLMAVVELLQGHPTARDWYIGLLLIDPQHRGRRLGTRLCAAVLDWIAALEGATVRLVVQHQNSGARTFWERQGFSVERETTKQAGRLENRVWILARAPGGVD